MTNTLAVILLAFFMAKHQLQLPGTLPSDAGVASSGWTFLRKTMFLSLGTIYKGRLHRKPKSWLSKGRCMNLLLEICPKCGQGGFRSPENFADVLYERSPGKNSTFATLGAIQSFHNNGWNRPSFLQPKNEDIHSDARNVQLLWQSLHWRDGFPSWSRKSSRCRIKSQR